MKCIAIQSAQLNKFHELGAQHGIPSSWRETPPVWPLQPSKKLNANAIPNAKDNPVRR